LFRIPGRKTAVSNPIAHDHGILDEFDKIKQILHCDESGEYRKTPKRNHFRFIPYLSNPELLNFRS
jgi:hypothetical protein